MGAVVWVLFLLYECLNAFASGGVAVDGVELEGSTLELWTYMEEGFIFFQRCQTKKGVTRHKYSAVKICFNANMHA